MKSISTLVASFVIFSACLISCKEVKNNKQQIKETVRDTVPSMPVIVLEDTIGVYKINNPEAIAYVVKMNQILLDIEKAINNRNQARMLNLMGKLKENQRNQLQVQSKLTDEDRVLFNEYITKIADKIKDISNRLSDI